MALNPYMEVADNPYMGIKDKPGFFERGLIASDEDRDYVIPEIPNVSERTGMVTSSLGDKLYDAERYAIGVGQALPAVGSALAAGIAAPVAALNAQLSFSVDKGTAAKVGEELARKITYVPNTPEGRMIAEEAMKPLNWAIEKIVMPVVGPPAKAVGQMADQSKLGDALEALGLSRDIGSNLVETGSLFGGIGALFTLIKKAPGLAKASIESAVRGMSAKNLEAARTVTPLAIPVELPSTGKGFVPPPAQIPVTSGDVPTRVAPQKGLMEDISTPGLEILRKAEKPEDLINPYMEVEPISRKGKALVEAKANPYLAVEDAKVEPLPPEIVQLGATSGGKQPWEMTADELRQRVGGSEGRDALDSDIQTAIDFVKNLPDRITVYRSVGKIEGAGDVPLGNNWTINGPSISKFAKQNKGDVVFVGEINKNALDLNYTAESIVRDLDIGVRELNVAPGKVENIRKITAEEARNVPQSPSPLPEAGAKKIGPEIIRTAEGQFYLKARRPSEINTKEGLIKAFQDGEVDYLQGKYRNRVSFENVKDQEANLQKLNDSIKTVKPEKDGSITAILEDGTKHSFEPKMEYLSEEGVTPIGDSSVGKHSFMKPGLVAKKLRELVKVDPDFAKNPTLTVVEIPSDLQGGPVNKVLEHRAEGRYQRFWPKELSAVLDQKILDGEIKVGDKITLSEGFIKNKSTETYLAEEGAGEKTLFFEPAEGFTRRPVEPEGVGGEPVRRSDIVKFLTEKLDVPIRTGRFRQKALGIFKPKLEVVRSKFANDIETIAHEIGHGLNKYLWGMKGKNLETAPLEAFSHELLPIATKPAKGQPPIQEGFAEFIRKYITHDAEAKKVAPTFYEFFEKELDKKSPEAKEIFIDARNQFDKWIKQPATQRILGTISIGEEKKSPVTWNDLYTQWVDELHPLKKVVDAITKGDTGTLATTKNPYELARLMAGWTGKADAFIEHKTFGFKDYAWKNKSLKDILNPVKDDLDNLRVYVKARRSLELRSRGIETGIEREDAAQAIREQVKHEKTFQELKQYQDDVLMYLRDAGIYSLKDIVKMKELNQDYTPFYRVMESGKIGLETGKGFEAGQPIKKIKGSWRDTIDPLESIIKNTYAFIQAAEKNTVVKSLVDLSNKHEGMGKFVEKIPIPMQKIIVKEPELLGILQRYGKWTETTKYKETQKTLGEKITNIGGAGEEIAGGSTRAAELMEGQAMEALRARGRTEAEAKMILDRIKKAPTAEIKSKIIEKTIEKMVVQETVKEFGLDIPNNIIELFRPSAFVPKENVISLWRNGKRELYQVHPDVARVVQALDRESTNSLIKVLSYPSRWLRAGATLTPEFILRNPLRDQFSAFTYSKYGFVPGIDLGRGIAHLVKGDDLYWKWKIGGGEHSMLVSLDREYLQKSIGDVLRENNATNIAGSIIKNPLKALQVLSELTEEGTRIGEFAKGVSKEGMTKEGIAKSAFASREVTLDFARKGTIGKEVNKLVAFWNANVQGTDKLIRELKDHPISATAKIVSAITLPSIGLYMANRNDPRWKELPAWQKNLFWIIMTKDNIYRIPKPFELGILFGSFPERILEAIDNQNPKVLDSLWKSMAQGATPGYVPNIVLPLAENWANKSFFMDRPIVTKGREGMMEEYQYQPYTTELAKKIGKGIETLTGIGVSPAKMENLIRGWTGGIGTYVLNIADKGLRMTGVLPDPPQPTKTFSDWPVTKAFTVRYPSSDSESIRQFYENYEKNNEVKVTALGLAKKEYKTEAAIGLVKGRGYVNMDSPYKAIASAQRLVQLVYANPKMHPDEKRQLIDKIYFQMIDMAKRANEEYVKRSKK